MTLAATGHIIRTMNKKIEDTVKQAQLFDECVSELSEDARRYFREQVKFLSSAMARGSGEKSAKALLFQLLKFLEAADIDTSQLFEREP